MRRTPGLWGLDWSEPSAVRADPPRFRIVVYPVGSEREGEGRGGLTALVQDQPPPIRPSQVALLLAGRPFPSLRVIEARTRPAGGGHAAAFVIEVERAGHDRDSIPVLDLEIRAPWLDRFLSTVKVDLLGHAQSHTAVPGQPPEPIEQPTAELDYRAKDYDTFRQMLLDRMAFHIPSWRERNPSDLGVTIVEVLAYGADYLSYFQDAVSEEAYLATARRRTSIKRHARMLDFHLHEGLEARTWVSFQVDESVTRLASISPELPEGTLLLNMRQGNPEAGSLRVDGGTPGPSPASRVVRRSDPEYHELLKQEALVFHLLEPAQIHQRSSRIQIYTWGALDYTLPKGTRSLYLEGNFVGLLAQGDPVIVVGYSAPDQIDYRSSRAVRLDSDPRLLFDPVDASKTKPVTEISWYPEDALTEELIVRSTFEATAGMRAEVWGNAALAQQGRPMLEVLPEVPHDRTYRPRLAADRIGYSETYLPYFGRQSAAATAVEQRADRAVASIQVVFFRVPSAPVREHVSGWLRRLQGVSYLTGISEEPALHEWRRLPPHQLHGIDAWENLLNAIGAEGVQVSIWTCRRDLLSSGPFSQDFTVDVEQGLRNTYLRFGDGSFGQRPPAGAIAIA
ncbi:MAG: hypothetical protein MI919_35715, partial [Holophagales bacterium]|nr:hypothetical protein [Holophagales bacterium]